MSDCPECGLPPTAITENVATHEPYNKCQNGHEWTDAPDE